MVLNWVLVSPGLVSNLAGLLWEGIRNPIMHLFFSSQNDRDPQGHIYA